ncbi:MAG TPA: energy transducer TonB [Pyrinomonadaceae bacterium]|jgi:TonB family protein
MRKIVSTTALALLLVSLVFDVPATQVPATAQLQVSWETYTFPGEEFSVELPEMPTLDPTDRQIKGDGHKFENARIYGAYGNGIVYLIRAYDKPRRNEDLDFFARYYMQSQVYTGQSSQPEFRRELQLGKFPGRQYTVKRDNTPAGIPISSLYVYLTGRHAYALRLIGADDEHPDAKRFFSSFNLTERPAGRQIIDEWKLPRPPIGLSNVAPPVGDRPALDQPATASDPKLTGSESAAHREGGAPLSTPDDGAAGRIYKAGETTRKAAAVSRPEPLYTKEARHNQVTGTVRLRFVASANGKVTNIVAITMLPDGLTENAILAASHVKFIPAVLDGRRVSQYVTIEYNFNIY